MMKINPETLHTKFDIYVLITFLIIILRYKKNNKNIYKIALERYICFHMSYYRGSRSPPLNLQHTQKYHGNYGECCFPCYDTKSGCPDKWPLLLQNPM
jgi:hypothetical protein